MCNSVFFGVEAEAAVVAGEHFADEGESQACW